VNPPLALADGLSFARTIRYYEDIDYPEQPEGISGGHRRR